MNLHPKQLEAYKYLTDKTTNEILFGGGAGGGKSQLGCFWLLKSSLKYPGTRWVMGRNSLKTLKDTTLVSFFDVCKRQGIKQGIHYRYNVQTSAITFFNESVILLKDLAFYPSDPNFDELGSLELTGAFVDECNQTVDKAWQILKSRCGRWKNDEYSIPTKILGSCNPAKNWVFTSFYAPSKRNELPANKKFIQALVHDNPTISPQYIENLRTLPTASRERLLFGNWEYDDDPSVLCDYDAICDAFTNEVKQGTTKYISADLAMKGRDRFVAGLWNGMVCEIRIDKGLSNGKDIELSLKDLMQKAIVGKSQTVVDSDGMGNYLESYLTGIKEFHNGAKAIDDKEYANLKSECAYKLAEVINKREIKIICDSAQKQRIIEELGMLKAHDVDADESRKRIIKKDLMKEHLGRSPDYLDMLIMRMYFEVKPRTRIISY